MRRLREQFPDELVVVGVHSAKFPSEHLTENIRQTVMRHDIEHPVVNDTGLLVWRQFGVRAWPTLVLVDPAGNYAGMESGEIDAAEFAPAIQRLIDEYEANEGPLDREPLDLHPETRAEPAHPFRFPARVLAAPGGRLYVADTGHHRLLELQLSESGLAAEVLRTFGSGQAGLRDGPAGQAAFHSPRGMAYVEAPGRGDHTGSPDDRQPRATTRAGLAIARVDQAIARAPRATTQGRPYCTSLTRTITQCG